MMVEFAFLRGQHLKEVKRRGIKATGRDELGPEKAMMTYGKGKHLHSYEEDGKVHHMVLNDKEAGLE